MSLHGCPKLFNQSFPPSSFGVIRVIRNSLFINSLPEPAIKRSVCTLSAYACTRVREASGVFLISSPARARPEIFYRWFGNNYLYVI
jgi:hypothetical protein